MCWCLVVCIMDDPGKLEVSTPALLYKSVVSQSYRNVDVSMFVAQFSIMCVCWCLVV